MDATDPTTRYLVPDTMTAKVFNPLIGFLARRGISLKGSRELAVQGRTSGEWRTTPVNPLVLGGHRYLVAPRGQTQWVRNIRVAGGGQLRLGRKVEEIRVTELPDPVKPAILREYVLRWKSEVGQFFDGIDEHSSDADLLAIAPGFPVFEVTAA